MVGRHMPGIGPPEVEGLYFIGDCRDGTHGDDFGKVKKVGKEKGVTTRNQKPKTK